PPDVTGPSCPAECLVLQLPALPLLVGDTVTLRCRVWQDGTLTGVRFYHGERYLGEVLNGTELSLSPLQLDHSGRYRCGGLVNFGPLLWWEMSAPVTMTVAETVHGECGNGDG
ncbi:FCRLA protein, partial [Hylia prasina]|nr:FCRLA protein [Hylia prasina]